MSGVRVSSSPEVWTPLGLAGRRFRKGCYLLASLAFLAAIASATPAPTAEPTPAGAPVSDAVRKAITVQYELTCTAVLTPSTKNIQALFATLAPEFANTDTKGAVMTRAAYIAQAQQQLPLMHGTDCSNEFTSIVAIDPSTVLVMNESHVAGDVAAADGKHDLDFSGRSRDTWKLENGNWLEVQSTDVHVTVKEDGNVMEDSGT